MKDDKAERLLKIAEKKAAQEAKKAMKKQKSPKPPSKRELTRLALQNEIAQLMTPGTTTLERKIGSTCDVGLTFCYKLQTLARVH